LLQLGSGQVCSSQLYVLAVKIRSISVMVCSVYGLQSGPAPACSTVDFLWQPVVNIFKEHFPVLIVG